MNRRRRILLLATSSLTSKAASRFDGVWHGTYNSQPTALLADGSYPEVVGEFEIRIWEKARSIYGSFQRRGSGQGPILPIKNGRRFGDRACFDVITESGDMRWCVSARGSRLEGTWSSGPQGGALLDGAGLGIRLFAISGIRLK